MLLSISQHPLLGRQNLRPQPMRPRPHRRYSRGEETYPGFLAGEVFGDVWEGGGCFGGGGGGFGV